MLDTRHGGHDGRKDTNMTDIEERINELFEELVPATGKADTEAGEIIRAITRIAYRNYNDGDHIGVGYGKETCNYAARYLAVKGGESIAQAIGKAWGIEDDREYDKALAEIEEAVVEYIEKNPELKEIPNKDDMVRYRDEWEDRDDTGEDDEEEWDEWEEDADDEWEEGEEW